MRGECLIVDMIVKQTLRSMVMNTTSRNIRDLIVLIQASEDAAVNYQILLGGNSWEVSFFKKFPSTSNSWWSHWWKSLYTYPTCEHAVYRRQEGLVPIVPSYLFPAKITVFSSSLDDKND